MSGPDKQSCLTVLADDGDNLDRFRDALQGIPRIRVAERLQSGGADIAWALMFFWLIRGHTLSDVVAVLGSLNIIAAELDR